MNTMAEYPCLGDQNEHGEILTNRKQKSSELFLHNMKKNPFPLIWQGGIDLKNG